MADEIIREVRRIRHEVSQQFNHDVHEVVAYYREYQERLKQSGKYRFAKSENTQIKPSPPMKAIDQ